MRSHQTFSVFFLTASLASPFLGRAEEMPVIRADVGYASQYVFRGVARTGASAQSALELGKDDFRAGLWANLPLKAGAEREINLNAAYAWQALKDLKLDISARQYWFGNTSVGGTRHSFEAAITATLAPVSGITPSLEFTRDFRLRAETMQLALGHSVAITGVGAYLDLSCFAGWATGDDWRPDLAGPKRHDSYGYWGAEVLFPHNIGYVVPHSTLVAGLHYSDAVGRSVSNGPYGLAKAQKFWVTLGVSLDF